MAESRRTDLHDRLLERYGSRGEALYLLFAGFVAIPVNGFAAYLLHLRMGQPAQEIIALSEELGTDLLVVGSGGPHQIRRAVAATMRRAALGRVSDVIVRSAPCPVLFMRGGRVQSSANL